MSSENKKSDRDIFNELHALGMERFTQRAIEDAKGKLAGAPARYIESFGTVVRAFEQIGKKLSPPSVDGRREVDLLSMARLRNKGLLTAEEIARFSAKSQAEIAKLRESDSGQMPRGFPPG